MNMSLQEAILLLILRLKFPIIIDPFKVHCTLFMQEVVFNTNVLKGLYVSEKIGVKNDSSLFMALCSCV